jgi:hypothetical protein
VTSARPDRTARWARRLLAPVAIAAVAACGAPPSAVHMTAPTAGAGPAASLPVGPGSQVGYTVQAQPAPGSCHYRWVGADPLPDPSCTPGATNPGVSPADLASTICRRGWTASVRPPVDVTRPEKVGSAAAYGYTGPFATGEYDHLVPLELGGDPNDPANLWLEPNDRPGATSTVNTKDVLESHLRSLVCAGRLPLGEAQRAIATDWVAARQHYGS